MNIALKLWNWTFHRSPQNAVQPTVQPHPIQGIDPPTMPAGAQPIDQYVETDSILGGPISIGFEQNAAKGPLGELIRARNNSLLLLGCYHVVGQSQATDKEDCHVRGIAGKCFYCELELQLLFNKGEISYLDAERLSLVCTDCGQITSSGKLCCPKHYAIVTSPDGTKTYLDPEDVEKQERQKTVGTILGSLAVLFSDESPEINIKDENND